ncbi:MAG TPA: LpqB family beta-propeller domain-containing protein, partial [Candidatus Tumulicola sp.]|nr:LpqB family beta-propeller domain-containing protein [Candidatus Tumulicola sp.]
MRTSLAVAVLLGVLLCTARSAGARTLQIADMARLVNVEEPAISPDGGRVAIVVIRNDLRNARYVDSLDLVDTATGATRTIVRGRDVAVPRWSPDGSHLAYLARPASDAPLQAFVRTRDGATRQITHAAEDVVDLAWSPDGRRIAYVAVDPPANAAA